MLVSYMNVDGRPLMAVCLLCLLLGRKDEASTGQAFEAEKMKPRGAGEGGGGGDGKPDGQRARGVAPQRARRAFQGRCTALINLSCALLAKCFRCMLCKLPAIQCTDADGVGVLLSR